MKFFIDNNLSKKIADGMKGFGEDVMHLQEKFSQDVKDIEWLPYIGENDMILVTRDVKIRYRPHEIHAIKEHNVGVFFLAGKNLTRCQHIQQLVRNWPRMKELAGKTKRPFAFLVPSKGAKFKNISLE